MTDINAQGNVAQAEGGGTAAGRDLIQEQNITNNITNNIQNILSHAEAPDYQVPENYKVKLKDYLEKVKDEIYREGLDNKRLSDYYQIHRAEMVMVNTSMGQVSKQYNGTITTIIEKFLYGKDNEWFLIVGASFGIGKTSMARWVASTYAKRYLDDPPENRINDYVPILVNLQSGLGSVYGQERLETVLRIVAPRLENKILLILDGLDEYNDGTQRPDVDKIRDLKVKLLDMLHDKYKQNLKVVITTRIRADILDLHDFNINQYVKILQFNPDQLNLFFQKYGVNLTYDDAINNFGLQDEEICKPLFAWMFALMHRTGSVIHVQLNSDWTREMRMTLIYMLFFHYILRGKYKDMHRLEFWNRSYLQEKEILRKIAALKRIYVDRLSSIADGSSTTETAEVSSESISVENRIKMLKSQISPLDLEGILSCYCDLRSDVGVVGRSISFLHGTMQEYLLAEYYIESLLSDSIEKLNVGMPSERTIFFINGLIDILNTIKTSRSDPNVRFIIEEGNSLVRSFVLDNRYQRVRRPPDPYQQVKSILDKLAENAYKSFNKMSIIYTDFFDVKKEVKEDIWREADISGYDYIILWIHRWISLCVLSKLKPENISSEDLESLFRYSNNKIPSYLKRIHGASVTRANFSRANLSGADLSAASLSDVDFSYSDLSGADLSAISGQSSIDLRIMLSNANLTGANLSNAKIPNADLSHANLSDVKAESVILPYADLSHANLSNANLTGANLSNANLTGANLSNANLTGANLTSSTILHCVNFEDLNCTNAVLSNSQLNQNELIEYLNNHLAKDIPKILTNNKPQENKENY